MYLNIFHPDVILFLDTKKENADEKIRVKTLSTALIVPDKFYELVANNETMYLFSPADVEREYGIPFSYMDITKEYTNMVNNENIVKTKVKARELETEISKLQQESGYPYVLNIDTANRDNNIDGRIVMSNICTEILQVHNRYELDTKGNYITEGTDVSCNLGSTNVYNMMHSPNFEKSIDVAMRALTFVTDNTTIDSAENIERGNDKYHAVGLGAMGLHTYLSTASIHYDTKEAVDFTDIYFLLLRYYALKSSNKIAKDRNATFYSFEKSKYADGSFFDKYIKEYEVPTDPKVLALFKDHHIPTKADWEELRDSVMKDGLYHSVTLAVAPTGSISYLNEASPSIQPITQMIEARSEKSTGDTYFPTPKLSNSTMPYLKSAYDMNMLRMIDVYAAAQQHVDQGISMTLYYRSTIEPGIYDHKPEGGKQTTRDLTIARNYAFSKDIKTIYYVRTFTDDEEEIGSNNCESCSI